MTLPELALINFSPVSHARVRQVLQAVNQQLLNHFRPCWGAAHHCLLHDSGSYRHEIGTPVLLLVDEPQLSPALEFYRRTLSPQPVEFVFTDLGEWSVSLSHEVLAMTIDRSVDVVVPGPDPRDRGNPGAWLLHSFEVCNAVERTQYEIEGIAVSNFVTPAYFRCGVSGSERNDYLGVGVDRFGVTPGSHVDAFDPVCFEDVLILGSEFPSEGLIPRGMERHSREGLLPRIGARHEALLQDWLQQSQADLPLTALSRRERRRQHLHGRWRQC